MMSEIYIKTLKFKNLKKKKQRHKKAGEGNRCNRTGKMLVTIETG